MNNLLFIPYLHSILKEQIVSSFNQSLKTDKEFAELAKAIHLKTSKRISVSTLKRILKLPLKNTPTSHTLDVLTLYVSGENYKEWCVHQQVLIETRTAQLIPDEQGLHLLDLCLAYEQFEIVIKYLEYLPCGYQNNELDKPTQYTIGKLLAKHLRANKEAQKKLLPQLAKHPQGRYLFFEVYTDYDYFVGYYGKGLEAYRKYFTTLSEEYELRFADTLLFWKAVLEKDIKTIKHLGFTLFHNVDYTTVRNLHWQFSRLVYLYEMGKISLEIIEKTLSYIIPFFVTDDEKLELLYVAFVVLDHINQPDLIINLYYNYQPLTTENPFLKNEALCFLLLPKSILQKQGKTTEANHITISEEQQTGLDFITFMGKIEVKTLL